MQQQVLTSTHLIQCIVWLRFTYMDIAKEKCLLLIQSVQKQNQLSKKKISILIKCELNRMHTNARKDQAHKLKCKKVQLLLLYTKPLLLTTAYAGVVCLLLYLPFELDRLRSYLCVSTEVNGRSDRETRENSILYIHAIKLTTYYCYQLSQIRRQNAL